jgi:hypothetical protein
MNKIYTLLLASFSIIAFAQDEDPKLSISGTVDIYGTVNTEDGAGAPGLLIATPEAANGFGLGMVNTVFSYDGTKSGVVADLAFGPRADDANMAGAINQLYAYYNLSESVTITAGQFNTFLGYEVISPAANFNYSVSYLFNEGPFSHTGVKIDVDFTEEDLSLLFAMTNGHGISSDVPNAKGSIQYGGQLGFKGQYLNFIYGGVSNDDGVNNDQFYVDYTGGFDLTESLYLGLNAAYSYSTDTKEGYQGAALYLQNSFSDTFALGLRPEIFTRSATGDSGLVEDSDVFALTLTANASIDDNLKLIGELRYDESEDGIIEGYIGEDMTVLTVAAVYSF